MPIQLPLELVFQKSGSRLAFLFPSGPGEQAKHQQECGVTQAFPSVSLKFTHWLHPKPAPFQWLHDSCREKRKTLPIMLHICCQEAKLCGAHIREHDVGKSGVWMAQLCHSEASAVAF